MLLTKQAVLGSFRLTCVAQRQAQCEQCAALWQIGAGQMPSVLLNDAVADRQAQAGAMADTFGGEERVEDS